jgi:hypothetical protein
VHLQNSYFPGLRFAYPGLLADTPFGSVKKSDLASRLWALCFLCDLCGKKSDTKAKIY